MSQLVPKKKRHTPNDALQVSERIARMRAFLDSFSQLGNIRLACLAAGVSRTTYYWWMDHSEGDEVAPEYCVDGIPFAQLADTAAELAADVLEEEARRRAVDGCEEPVFGQLGTVEFVEGKDGQKEIVRKFTGVVGSKKVYSDRLLEILLKARRPHVFRENVRVDAQVDVHHQVTDSARDRLAAKLLDAASRLAPGPEARALEARNETPSQTIDAEHTVIVVDENTLDEQKD